MNIDRWLLAEAGRVRLYVGLAVAAGLAGAVAVVLQALFLSRAVTAVFLEGAGLSDASAPLALLLAAIVARSALAWAREGLASEAAARIKADLRSRLFARITRLGPLYASGERTGELASTLTEGVESLDAYYSQYLPSLALALLVPATILIFVFPIDLLSGFVFLLTAPLIPIFMILIGKVAEMLTRRQWEALSWMSAHFLDVLQGLSTLRLFNRSRAQAETIATITERFSNTTLGVLRVAFLSALVLEITGSISTAVVAVEVGLRLLYSSIGFEQAFFILVLAPEFYLPLRTLGASFHAGMSGVAAGRRIREVLGPDEWGSGGVGEWVKREGASERVSDGGKVVRFPHSPTPPLPHSSIYFRDVSLAYDGGERVALKGVSFEVKAGERLALVGPSGAGKSSIASVLLRFVEPDSGEVEVNGAPLRDLPAERWRDQVAWVPQVPYLFAGSIADNIRLGCPEAGMEKVERAASLAGADGFIRDLPEGYETQIGERGSRLSGGQAQRIALARAFLKDAPILLLDEPTSNLDPESEAVAQEAIERLMKGRTVLVIAHRLRTIRDAGRIVVLDGGAVVETGTHDELVARGGLYAKLVAAHYGESGGVGEPPHFPLPGGEGRGEGVQLGGTGVPEGQGGGGQAARHTDPGLPGTGGDARAPRAGETPALPASALSPSLTPSLPLHPSPFTLHPSRPCSSWSVAVRLLRLAWPFRWWMVLAALLGVATVGAGIGLISTAAFLIASAALHPSVADLAVPIVGVRFFGISRGVFRYLERYISHGVTFRLLGRVRVRFYQAVEALPPDRLISERSGDLLNRVVADVETLQHFYVRVIAPPLVALAVTIAMWLFVRQFDSGLALLLVAFLLIGGIALPAAAHRLSAGPNSMLSLVRGETAATLVDGIQGLPDLLSFNQTERWQKTVDALGRKWTRLQRRMAWVSAFHSAAGVLLTNVAGWSVLLAAIPLVRDGRLEGVYLPVLVLAALASFEAVAPLPLAFQQLGSSVEAGRRLLEVSEGERERGREGASEGESEGESGPHSPTPLLSVRDLRFRYEPNGPWVLDGVSFDLHAGKRVAVVGPSGAGKSTLASILVRFSDYEGGSAVLDGRDLRQWTPEEVRQRVSMVPQRTHLFNTTIRENLMLARPGATEGEMARAAEQAGLHDFVGGLPDGYETRVGEQGLRLSGGERQRIAIARALLRDPDVLILDEAASNLDSLTERRVIGSILEQGAGRAVLLITHRLAELDAVDEVLVLHDGRIVERGSHRQLIQARGFYWRMWTIQNQSLSS